ncbi:MAG: hypothetical protein HRT35_38585, partial [Algicola sp.]|nr:hypothetical protein [Algicola sp.]
TGDTGQTPSTEPMDVNILERLKVSPTITPETTDLLGEQIDLNSGSISFKHTDISLPGNSSLDVAVRRVFKGLSRRGKTPGDFADWHLDIPNIHTTLSYWDGDYSGSWGVGQGCSGPLNPGTANDMHNVFQDFQYWNGDTLNVPGHVNDKLLEPTTNLTSELGGNISGITRVTKSNWRIKCFTRGIPGASSNADSFEGFIAYAPNGTQYTFDEPRLTADIKDDYKPREHAIKYQAYMMVSKIEDRFGNWVQYEYDAISRLTRIHANDGREITLKYNEAEPFEENISIVIANGREWRYAYTGSNANNRVLHTVMRPDTRSWTFDLVDIGVKKPIANNSLCGYDNATAPTFWGTITHPNGAVGQFGIKETQHGTSNIDPTQARENGVQVIPLCSNHLSLQNKILSGPGLPTLNWLYSYSQNSATTSLTGTMPNNISALNHKITTVNAPDGSRTKHYYNRDWTSPAQGMLSVTEQFDTNGTTPLSTTQTTYVQAEAVGRSLMRKTNIVPMDHRINKSKVVTTLHHSDGNTTYTTDNLSFNTLGSVIKTHEYNAGSAYSGQRKYIKTTFTNHISGDYYVLQLSTSQSQSNTDSNYAQLSST